MDDSVEIYWTKRLERCRKALEGNGFEAFVARDALHAREIILGEIVPRVDARIVSWADSMTLARTGVLRDLWEDPRFTFIKTFDETVSREEVIERRRQALLSDLFFTGTNALTESGQLVNLDMIGNRVAAITFGPKTVVITVGRNKLVPGLDEAMRRIKDYAAPVNAIRHTRFKTPCRETGRCMDCKSPDRICNYWSIVEKSFPRGRIKVILINEDLGL
ncbi:MAG: lactate utilization protein [Acidobacteriota bacterium]